MAEPFPAGPVVRIVYERGLQLLRSERGWLIPSSERLERVEHPGAIEAGYGVRHIIRDTALNVPFFHPRRIFDARGRPVSRARYLKGYVEDGQRRIYKYMVEHHLYCAVAHLGYLAEAYGGLAVLHNEHRWSLPGHVLAQSRDQVQDAALRHGEGVFTSLSSALDASRFLVWRERRGTPDTLPETLDRVMARGDGEVQMIVAPLEDVWRCSGTRLLAYRDGTARHHPITAHGGRCGAVLNDGDVWETRIDLPDNPEVRSPEAFRFDEEIDLLDYAWTTTCEVVRCVERVLPQVYALAVPGREPSRWFWLNE